MVITLVQTPLLWGHERSAGDFVFTVTCFLPKRTNWLIVGIVLSIHVFSVISQALSRQVFARKAAQGNIN
jgi:hypothetical protein